MNNHFDRSNSSTISRHYLFPHILIIALFMIFINMHCASVERTQIQSVPDGYACEGYENGVKSQWSKWCTSGTCKDGRCVPFGTPGASHDSKRLISK
jgi:hypothetical protein